MGTLNRARYVVVFGDPVLTLGKLGRFHAHEAGHPTLVRSPQNQALI